MRETIEHVLLVDDEDDYHFITRIVLKKAGFNGKFECFYSADEAMARLRTDSTKPDLILLDIRDSTCCAPWKPRDCFPMAQAWW
jgi:DNA-binding NtrC family response regulator